MDATSVNELTPSIDVEALNNSVKDEPHSRHGLSTHTSPVQEATADASLENLSTANIEENIRSFLTKDTVGQFTWRTVRERAEQNFNLPQNSLHSRKKEINGIVEKLITEYGIDSTNTADDVQRSHQSEGEPRKRSMESGTPTSSGSKRQKITKTERVDSTSDRSDGIESTSHSSSDEQSESDSKTKRRRTIKAKAKVSLKAVQRNLMSKSTFERVARQIDCKIGDYDFKLEPRVFSTGSCGWYFGSKVALPLGEQMVTCVVGLNCTGSKQWVQGKKKNAKTHNL